MRLRGTRAQIGDAFSIVLPAFSVGLDYWQRKLEQAIFEKWGHRVSVEFETNIHPVELGRSVYGTMETVTGVFITIENEDEAVEFKLRYL